jgi:hypothetical protein
MITPKHEEDRRLEAVRRHLREGGSIASASRELGCRAGTLSEWLRSSQGVSNSRDLAVQTAMDAVGTGLVPHSMWTKVPPKDGEPGYSVFHRIKDDTGDFRQEIRASIMEAMAGVQPVLPPRFVEADGQLVVLDPADVHIGKLSIAAETGYTYDIDIAAHRLVEGSRLLLVKAKALGATRVLLVIGNDIAHIDTPRRTTTSGTSQDTSGSIFSIYRAASKGYRAIVQLALDMELAVDVIFCPSNHDWVLGFTIAQELAAWFHGHPNFTATDYNISERHIKYYRFGGNLIMFTHADGAKEDDLPQIMLVEARSHIAECLHRYAYLHHFHHRMRRALGVRPMHREKDHIAMTATGVGQGAQEGDNLDIVYVRSPSPPDGWHHRNGYINRQAVEAFLHHAEEGRKVTLTEWF